MKKTITSQQDTKRQILDAAKKEFAEKGFDGARMGAISKGAKVNQALLHYHFGNKENLYKEVLISHTLFSAELANKLKNFTDALNMSLPEKLYIAIYLLVHVHLEVLDAEFRKIISRELSDQREHFKNLVRDYLIPRHEALEQTIAEGLTSGAFSTKNPLFVVIGLNTFIMDYINSKKLLEGSSWYERLYGNRSKEALLDFLVDHTFKALRPTGRPLLIPEVPQETIQKINALIEDITPDISEKSVSAKKKS